MGFNADMYGLTAKQLAAGIASQDKDIKELADDLNVSVEELIKSALDAVGAPEVEPRCCPKQWNNSGIDL